MTKIAILTPFKSNIYFDIVKNNYNNDKLIFIPIDYTDSIIHENVQKIPSEMPEEITLDIASRVAELKYGCDKIAYIPSDILVKNDEWVNDVSDDNIRYKNGNREFWVVNIKDFLSVISGELEFNEIFGKEIEYDFDIIDISEGVNEMDLSILITAYKASEFIEETLDSIMSQSALKRLINYEIIVGVDGCEETLNKLKEIRHKYPYLKILMMDENKGTYITRNTIAKEALYDNFLFFDSDDIMRDSMIESIMDVYNLGDLIRYKRFILNDDSKRGLYSYGTFFIKRGSFEKMGGFLSNRFSCDAEFLKRATFTMNVYVLEKELSYYRISPNQLTQLIPVGGDMRTKWGNENIKDFYSVNEIYIEPEINTFKEIN